MTNYPHTATGIGTYDKELLDAIKVQAQLMVDPIKGYEGRIVLSQFLQKITLTDDDPGINLTRLSQGRVSEPDTERWTLPKSIFGRIQLLPPASEDRRKVRQLS